MILNYSVLLQTGSELRDLVSAPAVSMRLYLLNSSLSHLLSQISVYSLDRTQPGAQDVKAADRVRLLYMNSVGLGVWAAMTRSCDVLGRVRRPPKSAGLILGKTFAGLKSELD